MANTNVDAAEWSEIFEAEAGSRPVMSRPPRMRASKKFIREVSDALNLDDTAAEEAADWIADKMERFAAAVSQPMFTIDGSGPVCSWCGTIWPLCGHHHLSLHGDDDHDDETTANDSPPTEPADQMSHTITFTRLPDGTSDDYKYTIGGTCGRECSVWYECDQEHPEPTDTEDESGIAHWHGVEHNNIGDDIGWSTRSSECGITHVTDWLDVERDASLGTYHLDIEWDGDHWRAYRGAQIRDTTALAAHRERLTQENPDD